MCLRSFLCIAVLLWVIIAYCNSLCCYIHYYCVCVCVFVCVRFFLSRSLVRVHLIGSCRIFVVASLPYSFMLCCCCWTNFNNALMLSQCKKWTWNSLYFSSLSHSHTLALSLYISLLCEEEEVGVVGRSKYRERGRGECTLIKFTVYASIERASKRICAEREKKPRRNLLRKSINFIEVISIREICSVWLGFSYSCVCVCLCLLSVCCVRDVCCISG